MAKWKDPTSDIKKILKDCRNQTLDEVSKTFEEMAIASVNMSEAMQLTHYARIVRNMKDQTND